MNSVAPHRTQLLDLLGSSHASSYPTCLERQFPHVFATIVSLWGTHRMDDYFRELLVTSRADRQGFPADAAAEILRLFSIYQAQGLSRPEGSGQATGWQWVEKLGYFGAAGND